MGLPFSHFLKIIAAWFMDLGDSREEVELSRILLIEDESSIADNIRYALEAEGLEVEWRGTLEEGRQSLATGVDLLILDVGLPDGNGFDFCLELRKTSAVPVIFLTARSEEIDRVVGLELGGDDYVVKPFSPRELAARVKSLLRRSAGSLGAAAPRKSGATPFEIDAERVKIRYFGEVLPLSRYEYRLLRVFVERPGRVLSRDQLMDLAWEEPEASLDRTVDAHVKSLRAKLKKIRPEIDPIETHRGSGYALKEDW